MAQFSTNEAVSLEKSVDNTRTLVQTPPEELDRVYELDKCVKWINSNAFKKVCLQFPDYLLPDSCDVATRLQNSLEQTVYVMGDSAYESCCVDYVTAQHVEADAIIHFGPKCFSKWTDLIPCLCIYDKASVDVARLDGAFRTKFDDDKGNFVVVLDTPYVHKAEEICAALAHHPNVKVQRVDAESLQVDEGTVVYVGANNRKLMNFRLGFRPRELYYYDPEEGEPLLKNYEENNAILKRRRFLVEKVKDSRTVGIIIGTLVIQNFIRVIDRIKSLLKINGKTYYVISVGRPTVAKLANFPEMDVYVLICCSMSDIYDSHDFYKPIVTAHDVEVALNPNATDPNFSYDINSGTFEEFDENALKMQTYQPEVSLLTGKIRVYETEKVEVGGGNEDKQLSLRSDGTVALNDRAGAGFLAARTFKGLEQNLGQTEVRLAEEGRKGIAQHYQNEDF